MIGLSDVTRTSIVRSLTARELPLAVEEYMVYCTNAGRLTNNNWEEMHQRIKYGFSILLLVVDAIRLFGERLKLSCIAVAPQAHRRLHLILNLSAQPDSDTPSVNETTDREAVLESL